MQAVQYIKSVPRYLTVRLLGKRWNWLYTSGFSCVRLAELDEPRLPGVDWVKVRTRLCGICGSDLATITAKGSPYFSPFTSCPFVFGHEVVGEIAAIGEQVEAYRVGDRVVIEPVLCCEVRGISPACEPCQRGHFANCENVTKGSISAGIQTGYCRDTGGGWSPYFLAHKSQLHRVPDDMADEVAVLIEPFACALHAALKADPQDEDDVLVIGAGTIGLLTVAAIRALGKTSRILVIAKHPHQQKLAGDLGADVILSPGAELYAQFGQVVQAASYQPELGKPVLVGGVDVTFDCVASDATLDDALRFTKAQGKVMVVGMPAIPKNIDWTSIWYKELRVEGTYTYGIESYAGERVRTFALGIRFLQKIGAQLRPLIGDRFQLRDYRQAIGVALHTSRSKSVKTLFDLREHNSD